jgi:coenzyme F420-reducing hydrogenase alpha subunit
MPSKTIQVDYLTRVEGEGALYVRVEDGRLTDAQFRIFEPPRFFEAFLRGRRFDEAPDITSRICGICPIAYQMSACNAMENLAGVTVGGALRDLRRLIYCGEWIESHALHIFMLHLPDFLGYPDAINMARDYPQFVRKGLALKKAGNDLMTVIGGREIHPVNLRIGGFHRLPTRRELEALRPALEEARETALETIQLTGGLTFPDLEQPYEFVAMRHPDEYAIHEGRVVSSLGLDIDVAEFNDHFEERHVERSNALHSVRKNGRYAPNQMGGAYCVGPLARYSLNFAQLPGSVQEAALAAGLDPVCTNPFRSIVVRSVEMLFACEEALRLIDCYLPGPIAAVPVQPPAGVGHGCTEAPRGICYHRYELDANGLIVDAQISPPTAQNQMTMEADLRALVSERLDLPEETLRHQCEQAVRNYDPCISCATHFLRLEIERVGG